MSIGSILAIYFLIWSTMAFVVLPFGVKTPEEAGEDRKLLGNTALSALAFVAFYLNFNAGWVGLDDIIPWLRPG